VNTQSIRAKPSHAQDADKKCPVHSSEAKEPSSTIQGLGGGRVWNAKNLQAQEQHQCEDY